MPRFSDSTEKIKDYIKSLEEEVLVLSNLFFRDYTCPSHCGGCCPRFSLDYVKDSDRWNEFKTKYPQHLHRFKERIIDGQVFMSDTQEDHNDYHCRNLNKENGRCMIHEANPFSCEFELMKLGRHPGTYRKSLNTESFTILTKKLFGRGWAMKRIDGERGALCEMIPFNYTKFLRDIELLKELREIVRGFNKEIPKLNLLINYLDSNKEGFKTNTEEEFEKMNKIIFTDTQQFNSLQDYKQEF